MSTAQKTKNGGFTAEEKAAIWPRLTDQWPAYDRYAELTDRELRVFRLVPKT